MEQGGPELKALLRDNTEILMGCTQSAAENAAAFETADQLLAERQEQLRDAIGRETDEARLRKLEAAFTNVCRRRRLIAQGSSLARVVFEEIPLAEQEEEGVERGDAGEGSAAEGEEAGADEGTLR